MFETIVITVLAWLLGFIVRAFIEKVRTQESLTARLDSVESVARNALATAREAHELATPKKRARVKKPAGKKKKVKKPAAKKLRVLKGKKPDEKAGKPLPPPAAAEQTAQQALPAKKRRVSGGEPAEAREPGE